MRTLRVRQVSLEGDHICIHQFLFPEFKDDGFYRTMISYGAFFESCKRRNWSENYLYTVIDEFITPWERKVLETLPVIEHKNLLDFFDKIGYDRKKKKIYD